MTKYKSRLHKGMMDWLLFGAGGMTLAIVFPAILLVLLAAGFASPTVDSGLLSFAQVKGLLGNWFMALCLMGTVFLTIWHACHRIYHTLHDLTVHVTKLHFFFFYGLAAALSFALVALQFLIYCRLF